MSSRGTFSIEKEPLDGNPSLYAHLATVVNQGHRFVAGNVDHELVAAQGHQGMGVPPFAGFEVGYRLVKRYVADAGISLAEALTTSDILTKH